MIHISFVYCFYNNIDCVKNRLKNWSSFSLSTLKELQFILIDDCSDDMIDKKVFDSLNMNLVFARIDSDILWNQSGAHNLGSHLADSKWLLMMDIDHWIDEKSCIELIKLKKQPNSSFYFPRKYLNNDLAPAPNIYLIEKEKFWNIGGYDEDFAGCYGYEDKLMHYIIKNQTHHSILSSVKVNVDNAPTKSLDRSRDRNKLLLDTKLSQFKKNNYKNGKVLRFDWKEIIRKDIK